MDHRLGSLRRRLARAVRPTASLATHQPSSAGRETVGGPQHRPELSIEQRQALVGEFDDDITLLENITGEDFSDWRSATGRGSYKQRIDG